MKFFTADHHIGHENILRLCKRPFASITEHDDEIVSRHNTVVTDYDEIHDLGDLGFRCSPWYVAERIKSMKGKRIVILGNHDKPFRQAYQKGYFKDMIKSGKLELVGGDCTINDPTIALSQMITVNGQKVMIGHYSYRTWPTAFRGTWHLFGHSHSNLSPFYRSFDIGVDTNNYYPWSWEAIEKRMLSINSEFEEK